MGRDRGLEISRPSRPGLLPKAADVDVERDHAPPAADGSSPPVLPVTLTRTRRGWSVVSPTGTASAGDLVEGLSLADLIAEESGALVEPDRTARRSARGPGQAGEQENPVDVRVAALERTVAQLEHALAARVSTEQAIGVLAERNRTTPRVAFESLRREARSSGRPVAELARAVLAGLGHVDPGMPVALSAVPGRPVTPPTPRPAAHPSPAAAADGHS